MGTRRRLWTASPAFAVLLASPLAGHLATRRRRDLATGYLCIGPVAFASAAGLGSGLAFPHSFEGNSVVSLSRIPATGSYRPFPGRENGLRTGVLPEGRNLLLMVSVSLLSYHPA